jgi:hypothetical protein
MAKAKAELSSVPPQHCFVKELAGENPPAFSAMKKLYESSSALFALRPWEFMEDGKPIVVRDSVNGELCYCSVMGALGEVYSVHAYIGPESFRLYRMIAEQRLTDPAEFFAIQRSVSVEFVSKKDLERQDRELLMWLGHPQGRGSTSPVFRAMRPGFHPWFVSAGEAQTLDECIRGTIALCSEVMQQKRPKFWSRANTYPLVSLTGDGKSQIELIQSFPPPEPPLPPAQLDPQKAQQLRGRDYPIRGGLELDYILSTAPMGNRNERKSCTSVGIGADPGNGLLYPPVVGDGSVSPGDSLARVFAGAVEANRALPAEVRVRTKRFKDSLAPLLGSFGVEVRVASRLPAADDARAHLMRFMEGEF